MLRPRELGTPLASSLDGNQPDKETETEMMKLLTAILTLAACAAQPATSAAEQAVTAPTIQAYRFVPASAAQPETACHPSSTGYACPTGPGAVLIASAWTPTARGAVVLYPIALSAGEHVGAIRAWVDCAPGDVVEVSLVLEAPDYNGFGAEEALTTRSAACRELYRAEAVDLAPTNGFTPDPAGYRHASVRVTFASFGCVTQGCSDNGADAHARGLEISSTPPVSGAIAVTTRVAE